MAKKKTNQKKTSQTKKKVAPKGSATKANVSNKNQSDSILLRKFDRWEPAKPFVPKKTEFKKDFTAPKFIKGNNKKLKEILLRNFSDLKEAEETVAVEAKAATVKKAPAKKDNTAKQEEALNARENEIKALEKELDTKKSDLEKLEQEIAKKEENAKAAIADAEKVKQEAESLKAEAEKEKEAALLKDSEAAEKASMADTKLAEAETAIADAEKIKKEAEALKAEADKSKAEVEKLKADAEKKVQEIKAKEDEIAAKTSDLTAKETEIAEKLKGAEAKVTEVETKEKAVAQENEKLAKKEKDLENKALELTSKEEKLSAKEAELLEKEEELNKTIFTKVSESAQKISSLKPDFSKMKAPDLGNKNSNIKSGGAMNKGIISLVAGFVFLVVILVGASISNTGKFYLENSKKGLTVYQGKFAPKGKFKLMTLPEVYAPENVKNTEYEKDEVYTLIFNFYLDKVKTLAKAQGTPDFDKIEKHLKKAVEFAPGLTEKNMIKDQLKALKNVSENYKTGLLNLLEPAQEKPAKDAKAVKAPEKQDHAKKHAQEKPVHKKVEEHASH